MLNQNNIGIKVAETKFNVENIDGMMATILLMEQVFIKKLDLLNSAARNYYWKEAPQAVQNV